jgi:tRNA-splicing ligase RtcB (3'-phosphate/5'-hydroxy nucleic acid ligase)
VWGRDVDEQTVRQLREIASMPYAFGHVAAMPDAHVSEGVAVGTVFATLRTVVPRALGGDLGCGMSAIRFAENVGRVDRRLLVRLVADLGKAIPTGDFAHRGSGIPLSEALEKAALSTGALAHAMDFVGPRHLGTLGGGNHFVEVDSDADGGLWLLVHSGSRGLGARVFAHHAKVASELDPRPLSGLDTETEQGAAYLADLAVALAFARENRRVLETRALDIVSSVLGMAMDESAVRFDVHHNFVARERWLDHDLYVHRKGAVAAPAGELALVPGSMGTASYVVRGTGHSESFGSCSHGAGRRMSRREARTKVRPAALARAMRRVVYPEGMEASLVTEAPEAYRDVRHVLDDEADLLVCETRLEPLAVLKG